MRYRYLGTIDNCAFQSVSCFDHIITDVTTEYHVTKSEDITGKVINLKLIMILVFDFLVFKGMLSFLDYLMPNPCLVVHT